jgi:type IV pilus assembly protein PilC
MAKISYNKMAKLFKRLETSYRAGIDLLSAYQKERTIGSPQDRLQASRIVKSLKNGEALASAMRSVEGYFPELAIAVVQAGETGGRLEDSFKRLSKHYKDLVEFRNKFLMSIAWPAFELVACVVVFGLLILVMHYVMVNISGLSESIDWFGMGSTTGNFLLYVGVMAGIFSTLGILIVGSIKGWFGTLPMRIARRVPLLGKTIESLALSRLAWTMSVAENAAMDAIENAKLALSATENYYYLSLQSIICDGLRSGKSFYQAFGATDAFPQEFLDYVDVGETAGELSETMDRASRDYQQRAEDNMKVLGTIGFVLMFGFVAIVIGSAVILLAKKLYIDPINNLANGL